MEELKFIIRFIFDRFAFLVLIGAIAFIIIEIITLIIDILADDIENQRIYYHNYKFSPKVQATIYVVGTIIIGVFLFFSIIMVL